MYKKCKKLNFMNVRDREWKNVRHVFNKRSAYNHLKAKLKI